MGITGLKHCTVITFNLFAAVLAIILDSFSLNFCAYITEIRRSKKIIEGKKETNTERRMSTRHESCFLSCDHVSLVNGQGQNVPIAGQRNDPRTLHMAWVQQVVLKWGRV